MEGVASKEDIDNVCKLGFNHPMGPLALCDLIGNDVVLHVMEVLYEALAIPNIVRARCSKNTSRLVTSAVRLAKASTITRNKLALC